MSLFDSSTKHKSRLRWYHGYYLLAGLNLFTLLATLFVSHATLWMYSDSIQREQNWSVRVASFYRLAKLASAVNAPGNDIFRSHDVASEKVNLEDALSRFMEAADEAKSEIRRELTPNQSTLILRKVSQFTRTVEKVAIEGHEVLSLFAKGDEAQAASRMAVMDNWNSQATDQIGEACEDLQKIRNQHFMADISSASVLNWVETGVAVFVLTLIIAITWFGQRLGRLAEEQEKVLHCKTVDLELAHEYLQENHRNLEEFAEELQAKTQSLEEAQIKAEQASLAKSQFLASMSHEIRTPLTAIIGYSEELASGGKDYYDPKAIESIHRNGRHLLELINDILDLSKIEAGRLEVEHIATPLTRLIADVVEMNEPRAAAKGLKIEFAARNPIPTQIFTDPTRLRQILINLIGNAIKFTSKGQVKLECGKVTDAFGRTLVKFYVTDSGIGMNELQQKRLFHSFTQADQSTSRRFGGTGLGLVISKRLAEMLGGEISVTSQEGVGSTFAFTISPGMIDDVPHTTELKLAPRKPESIASAAAPIQFKAKVLFAEDGIDNQRLINAILKKAGCEVTMVENGQQTLDAVHAAKERGENFDIIITDMMMPVMDGYTSVARLRQEGYTGPIIALTAHAMAGERERCLAAGCDDFATKPINRQGLLEMIRYHVQMAQQTCTAEEQECEVLA